MGILFSCCRRQRSSEQEREPLLPRSQPAGTPIDQLKPSPYTVQKIADVAAAVNAGKLPSQNQLNKILIFLLRAEFLGASSGQNGDDTLSEPGRRVVEDFRAVAGALLQFGLEKNYDNRVQDLLFQCSQLDSQPIHADVVVDSVPADAETLTQTLPSKVEVEQDAVKLAHSLRILSELLLTSSTFRLILSDLFITAREIVADIAADIGHAAVVVENAVNSVEEVARPYLAGTANPEEVEAQVNSAAQNTSAGIQQVGEDAKARWEYIDERGPDRVKQVIISRIQQAIAQARSNPAYQVALQTIITLLRKYIDKCSMMSQAFSANTPNGSQTVPTLTPLVWTDDPHLSQALQDLSTLLSRLSSGHSLSGLSESIYTMVWDIANIPTGASTVDEENLSDVRAFFAELGSWFDLALKDPSYAPSADGRAEISTLYDRAQAFIQNANDSDPKNAPAWVSDIRRLTHEYEALNAKFMSDKTSQKLFTALANLSSSSSVFLSALTSTTTHQVSELPRQAARKSQQLKQQAVKDILTWLLPRLLRVIRVIPMPRVEYQDSSIDAVIDALLLNSSLGSSIIPDHIRFQTFSEIELDFTPAPVSETRNSIPSVASLRDALGMSHGHDHTLQTYTRVKIHVDGIRLSAEDIGYYFQYKGPLGLGYEDEGLVSMEVGSQDAARLAESGSGGISLDIELEVATDGIDGTPSEANSPLFTVRDVHFNIPELHFSLNRTKHYMLNSLLQPLVGPVARSVAGFYLRRQVWEALDTLAKLGGHIRDDVETMRRNQSRRSGHEVNGLQDYWTATLNALSANSAPSVGGDEDDDDDDDNAVEEYPLIETETRATAKGIIRTTRTYDTTSSSSAADGLTSESTLAIGVGPQILPGKGGPLVDGEDEREYGPRDVAREALEEVQDAVDSATATVNNVQNVAGEIAGDVSSAQARGRKQSRREMARDGWRSEAFSL